MSEPQPTPRQRARLALEAVTPTLLKGMRQVIATPVDRLQLPWGAAEFEVCPFFYRIVAIPSDEEIVPDLTPELIPDDVIGDDSIYEVFGDVVMEWLADTWRDAGGEQFPYPGCGFFHGYPERYDFRSREWMEV